MSDVHSVHSVHRMSTVSTCLTDCIPAVYAVYMQCTLVYALESLERICSLDLLKKPKSATGAFCRAKRMPWRTALRAVRLSTSQFGHGSKMGKGAHEDHKCWPSWVENHLGGLIPDPYHPFWGSSPKFSGISWSCVQYSTTQQKGL